MRKFFLVLLLFSFAYLMTGVVYQAGGFGVDLVIKPHPSFSLAFGGGEEGAWQRLHPDQPDPWWQGSNKITVLSGDWEDGQPLWLIAYFVGYFGLLLTWPIYLIVFLVRFIKQHRRAQANVL